MIDSSIPPIPPTVRAKIADAARIYQYLNLNRRPYEALRSIHMLVRQLDEHSRIFLVDAEECAKGQQLLIDAQQEWIEKSGSK